MNNIEQYMWQILGALPFLVVTGVGFVLSMNKYRQSPRAYLWAAIGTGLMFLQRVASLVYYMVVMPWIIQTLDMGNRALVISASGLILSLLLTIGIACVVVAVFTGRAK